jgi:hypothetical protein
MNIRGLVVKIPTKISAIVSQSWLDVDFYIIRLQLINTVLLSVLIGDNNVVAPSLVVNNTYTAGTFNSFFLGGGGDTTIFFPFQGFHKIHPPICRVKVVAIVQKIKIPCMI